MGRPHLGFSDAAVPKDEDPQQDPRGVHELLVLPVARLAWPAHVDWSVPRIIIVVGRAMSAASQCRATFLAGALTWIEQVGNEAHVRAEDHVAVEADSLCLACDVIGNGILGEECGSARDVRLLEQRGEFDGVVLF